MPHDGHYSLGFLATPEFADHIRRLKWSRHKSLVYLVATSTKVVTISGPVIIIVAGARGGDIADGRAGLFQALSCMTVMIMMVKRPALTPIMTPVSILCIICRVRKWLCGRSDSTPPVARASAHFRAHRMLQSRANCEFCLLPEVKCHVGSPDELLQCLAVQLVPLDGVLTTGHQNVPVNSLTCPLWSGMSARVISVPWSPTQSATSNETLSNRISLTLKKIFLSLTDAFVKEFVGLYPAHDFNSPSQREPDVMSAVSTRV